MRHGIEAITGTIPLSGLSGLSDTTCAERADTLDGAEPGRCPW